MKERLLIRLMHMSVQPRATTEHPLHQTSQRKLHSLNHHESIPPQSFQHIHLAFEKGASNKALLAFALQRGKSSDIPNHVFMHLQTWCEGHANRYTLFAQLCRALHSCWNHGQLEPLVYYMWCHPTRIQTIQTAFVSLLLLCENASIKAYIQAQERSRHGCH